jgi:hypothetical protein
MRLSYRQERLLEFLVTGLAMGITEDLIAVWLSTGKTITWSVLGIVFAIALPFAFLSEFVVDHPEFLRKAIGIGRKNQNSHRP